MRNRRAVRITIVFFTVLLILTFCSRTIYRSTLPKVRVSKPIGGTLKYNYEIDTFDIAGEEETSEYIPFVLSRGLTVLRILAQPGIQVNYGDGLIAFSEPDGLYLLNTAKAELLDAQDDCSVWDVQMANERAQLESKLKTAASREEASRLRTELNLLLSGVLNDNSTRAVYAKRNAVQEVVDYLMLLKESGWIYRANTSGTVCSLSVKEGDTYTGLSPLATLAGNGQTMYLHVPLEKAPSMKETGWTQTVNMKTTHGLIPAEVTQVGKFVIIIRLPNTVPVSDIAEVIVKLESPYEQMIVPSSVVTDSKLFLIETTTGDWGQTIYRARLISVVVGNNDGSNTAIREGLNRNDRIITYSSADIEDNQIVILDSYE